MDFDRIMGASFGASVLIAIFTLPFGSFYLHSNQIGGTFFGMSMQLVEDITGGAHPANLLIAEIIILTSFIFLVVSGVLGFYPFQSGVIGVLGMALLTMVSILNPALGFNVQNYGVGYFIAWGASIAALAIGMLKPNERRKLSYISFQSPSNEVVETDNPSVPMDLFKPLSKVEESKEPSALMGTPSSSQPSISLPFSPFGAGTMDEMAMRIKAFLIVLEDEEKENMISKEAYERLRIWLGAILDRLEAERRKYEAGWQESYSY